jgi:hypothetical protein
MVDAEHGNTYATYRVVVAGKSSSRRPGGRFGTSPLAAHLLAGGAHHNHVYRGITIEATHVTC